jgi:hypothetical protein
VLVLDLPLLVEEAQCVSSSSFIDTVERAISLLHGESGRVGNLTVINHLVKLKPLGEALIIGDLHGDLESLVIILQKSRFLKKMEKKRRPRWFF